jgi:hypothetical protein
VALIGRGSRRRGSQAAEERAELKQAVQPENGHDTLGGGLAAVEDRLIEGETRFDAIDVHLADISLGLAAQNQRLVDHIIDVAPVMAYVRKQMRKGKK